MRSRADIETASSRSVSQKRRSTDESDRGSALRAEFEPRSDLWNLFDNFPRYKTIIARSDSDEAIHVGDSRRYGLLRGACHRARIRATRWLAMTENPPLIAARRQLDKTPVPGRADQDFVDADARRHAGDEGDGAAEGFGLQHPRLL